MPPWNPEKPGNQAQKLGCCRIWECRQIDGPDFRGESTGARQQASQLDCRGEPSEPAKPSAPQALSQPEARQQQTCG